MAQNVKFVVDDLSLRSMANLERRVAEWLPHVHHCQADLPAFFGAEPAKEQIYALLGAVFAPEPNGPFALQVADDDAVAMTWADSDFVDADHLGGRLARAA